ncbi:MAG: sensor histidine kinase [Bacteroidales bacterium]
MKEKNAFLQFISRHQYAMVWLAIYLFLIASGSRFDWVVALISSTIAIAGMLSLDRFVRCVMIKKLLRPHRQVLYYVASLGFVTFWVWLAVNFEVFIFSTLIHHNLISFPDEVSRPHLIYPIFKMVVLFLGTYAITTISYLLSQTKEASKKNTLLHNEKLDMELRYLKAQINPHFLFNALNNIYSLVYTNDENAAESILKLSEMLRYVTDECQTDKISISKEVKYLENFIDFQLMRMENHPNIEFVKEIRNPELKIPPMIFQPLVENCFKHSRLESNKNGFIRISLFQTDRELIFETENSQSACVFNKQTERGGIGVNNVQKRLELAYGKNFHFHIENNSHFYKTELVIKLEKTIQD